MSDLSARHQSNQIITGVASGRRGRRTAGRRVAPLVGLVPHHLSLMANRLTAGLQSLRFAVLLIALLLVALAGCSTIRLGYEKLPFLAGWEIDSLLDLNREQEALVDRQLKALQAWHRETQLPKYAALLKVIEDQAEEPMTVARVATWRNDVLATWPALVDRLAPAVAELAVTLSPAQLAHLERKLAEGNQKIEREYFVGSNPKTLRAARIKRSRERAESFLGHLNAPQMVRLEQRADAEGTLQTSHWWALRMPRQQIIVDLLRDFSTTRPPLAEATARARTDLMALVFPSDPGMRQKNEAANAAGDQYMADMLQQSSAVQRRHLVEKLRGYGNDLNRLMGQPAD